MFALQTLIADLMDSHSVRCRWPLFHFDWFLPTRLFSLHHRTFIGTSFNQHGLFGLSFFFFFSNTRVYLWVFRSFNLSACVCVCVCVYV